MDAALRPLVAIHSDLELSNVSLLETGCPHFCSQFRFTVMSNQLFPAVFFHVTTPPVFEVRDRSYGRKQDDSGGCWNVFGGVVGDAKSLFVARSLSVVGWHECIPGDNCSVASQP